LPAGVKSLIGIRIPLIKISGKRITLDSIIILEGDFDAGEARSTPSEEKQKDARIVPKISPQTFTLYDRNINPKVITTIFIMIP
jgi:hypothetical protein